MIEFTEQQKELILYHYRMAAWYRMMQWENEEAIEKIIGCDIDNTEVEDLAVIVGPDMPVLGGDGDFGWEEIEDIIMCSIGDEDE